MLPGRLGIQKNQIGLLLALDRLVQRRTPVNNIRVLMVGRKRDMRTAWLVEQLARRPRLRQMVGFMNAQVDMRSLYWAVDALAMPSLWEGLSNAALEGCACGLPAILSHAANVDHIVVHGETGWEVPTVSVAALSEAMQRLVDCSDDELRDMGRLGHEHVTKRFAPTPTHVVERTVEVYDQLLRARPGEVD